MNTKTGLDVLLNFLEKMSKKDLSHIESVAKIPAQCKEELEYYKEHGTFTGNMCVELTGVCNLGWVSNCHCVKVNGDAGGDRCVKCWENIIHVIFDEDGIVN